MITVIIGGSGSGKSEYAEQVAVTSAFADTKTNAPLIYVATMQPFGEETGKKIERHHDLRKDKGFATIEQYVDVSKVARSIPEDAVVLLECMSNLLANEVYRPDKAKFGDTEGPIYKVGPIYNEEQAIVTKIVEELLALEAACNHLVIVTNDVFASGERYDEETTRYVEMLGQINVEMAKRAADVVEVICGIPVRVSRYRS